MEPFAGNVELGANALHLDRHLDLTLVLRLFIGDAQEIPSGTVSSSMIALKVLTELPGSMARPEDSVVCRFWARFPNLSG